jgi:hypothetical protein
MKIDENITPNSHVAEGEQNSKFLSTTTSLESAKKWAKRYKARIAKITINKGDILDITKKEEKI